MLAQLTIALVLGHAAPMNPSAVDPGEPEDLASPSTRPTIGALRLDSEGVDAAALRSALELRLRVDAVLDHRHGTPTLRPNELYVQVLLTEDGELRLALVTADGRAFDRVVDPGSDAPERVAAATISNLVVALEAGSLAPDRTGAAAPEVESGAADELAEPADRPPTAVVARPPSTEGIPWGLGVGGDLGVLLGPGLPRGADVFSGWSGALAVAVRGPRGVLALLSLRGAGRLAVVDQGGEPYRLARLRIGVGGGYLWQRRELEAEAVASLTAEPWWVVRGGARQEIFRDDQAGRRWLFGGALRLAAGYRFDAGDLGVRVGPWIDLAGAFAVDGRVGAPVVRSLSGDPLFRLGAFELGGGLELRIWFDLPRRSEAKR